MDIFSTQIVATIKKLEPKKEDQIVIRFSRRFKESATNITLKDIQQALQHMVSNETVTLKDTSTSITTSLWKPPKLIALN